MKRKILLKVRFGRVSKSLGKKVYVKSGKEKDDVDFFRVSIWVNFDDID